jgi:hypothetical protein
MTPDQENELIQNVSKIGTKMDMLISDDGSSGRVPEMARTITRHDRQISYWKGAIAVVAFLLLMLGGEVVAHILKGGK